MLKKIRTEQARIGMHIHKLEGAWLNHPFWKVRFVLSDPQDLRRLQDSGVPYVWIDDALGLDVATPEAPEAPPPPDKAPAPPLRTAAAPSPAAPATRDLADELGQAAAICREGRAAVTKMFGEARLGLALDAEHCLPLVNDIADSV